MPEELASAITGRLLEERVSPTMSEGFSTRHHYATVCVTINPSETPPSFLRKVLSICASKLGSNNVRLASQVMVVLNVCFDRRAGLLAPEVLLIKDPKVFSSSAREAKAREDK